MANTSNGGLDGIYERLSQVPEYHPFEAETYADWSLEAGDVVSISRGEETYSSPVHTSRMVWKGQPQTSLNSTGSKEREAISKVSRQKYGRGSSALLSEQNIYHEFYSEDGYFHSELEMSASRLETEFTYGLSSLRGDLVMTASDLTVEFERGLGSMHSEIQATASNLTVEFNRGLDSMHSEIEATASNLTVEFNRGLDSMHSEIEATASNLTVEFSRGLDSMHSEIEATASNLTVEFSRGLDSMHSEIQATASDLTVEFNRGLDSMHSEIQATASNLTVEFERGLGSMHSEIEATASNLTVEFNRGLGSMHSEIEATASNLTVEFNRGLDSMHSEIEATASNLTVEFNRGLDSMHSEIQATASDLTVEFNRGLDSMHSEIVATASDLTVEFNRGLDSMHSEIEATASNLTVEFERGLGSMHSEIEATASNLTVEFNRGLDSMHSEIQATASDLTVEFNRGLDSMHSEIVATASDLTVEFNRGLDSMHSEIQATASDLTAAFTNGLGSLHGEITATASSLRSEYSSGISSVRSAIEQEADRIDLLVEGTGASMHIKPAQIQAAINAATGQSKITLSADNIEFDGEAVATSLTGQSVMAGFLGCDDIQVTSDLHVDYDTRINLDMGDSAYLRNMIVSARVEEVGGVSILHLTTLDGEDIPFEKATSGALKVTGSWSGNTFTVAEDENGQDLPISTSPYVLPLASQGANYVDLYVATPKSTSPYYDLRGNVKKLYLVYNSSGRSVQLRSEDSTASTSQIYAQLALGLLNRTITSNGTYTPTSPYIGFNLVRVNVTPTISSAWSDSKLTVSTVPAAGSNFTLGFGSQPGTNNIDLGVYPDGKATYSTRTVVHVPVKVDQVYYGSADVVRYRTTVSGNVSDLLETKEFTANSNGTPYTPSSGKIGFSSVTVNVNPTLSASWSSNEFPLTIGTNPGTHNYTIGFGGLYGAHTIELKVVGSGTITKSAESIVFPYKIVELGVGGNTSDRYTGGTISYNYSTLLENVTLSENKTYTQLNSSPYIGYGSVTVAVVPSISTEWSGSEFPLTIKTNPAAGSNKTIGFNGTYGSHTIELKVVGSGTVTKSAGSIVCPYKIVELNSGGNTTDRYTGGTISYNYSSLLEADKVISENSGNNWIEPASGKIGFSRVKVNVTPTINSTWASNTSFPLTITTTPSAQSNMTIGFGQSGTYSVALGIYGNGNATRASSTSVSVPVKIDQVSTSGNTTRYTSTVTSNISGLLQTRRVTANDTYYPDNTHVGLSAVEVAVPLKVSGSWNNNTFIASYDESGASDTVTTQVNSAFNSSSEGTTRYYITATRQSQTTGSWVNIENTKKYYKLGAVRVNDSTARVQVQAEDGLSVYPNTASLDLGFDWGAVSQGKRKIYIKAGGTTLNVFKEIGDFGEGAEWAGSGTWILGASGPGNYQGELTYGQYVCTAYTNANGNLIYNPQTWLVPPDRYDTGYNAAHVTGSWSGDTFNYSKTNNSSATNAGYIKLTSYVGLQVGGGCYSYVQWVSDKSQTPTSIPELTKTLVIENVDGNTVTLRYSSTGEGKKDTGYNFAHNMYYNGTARLLTLKTRPAGTTAYEWPVTVTRYDNTTFNLTIDLSSVASQISIQQTGQAGSSHQGELPSGKYIYLGIAGVYDTAKTWLVPSGSASHSPSISNVWTSQSIPSGATRLDSIKRFYEMAKEDSDNFCIQVKCGTKTKTYYCTP